jgi:hypothetical protein
MVRIAGKAGDDLDEEVAAAAAEIKSQPRATIREFTERDARAVEERRLDGFIKPPAKHDLPTVRLQSVDTTSYKLVDWTCLCCAKSFRTMRAKQFCSDKCSEKGPSITVIQPREGTCECCGALFRSKRFDARYCKPACQKAAKRKELAELSRTTLLEAA